MSKNKNNMQNKKINFFVKFRKKENRNKQFFKIKRQMSNNVDEKFLTNF